MSEHPPKALPIVADASGPRASCLVVKAKADIIAAGDDLPAIDNAREMLCEPNVPLPTEVIKTVLYRGTKAVFGGVSKGRKTWGLLDLGISVATGAHFLCWETNRGKVLFINLEIPKPLLKERIAAIMAGRKITTPLDDLHVWTLRGYTGDFDRLLQRIVKQIGDTEYSLIILDPIYKGMIGRSENTASGVNEICHCIEQMVVQTGAAVIYSHHFTKGNSAHKDPLDRLSGSGVFARDADTIMTLTPHQIDNCYTVELTLRNFPAQPPFVVQWDYPIMVCRDDLKPEQLKGKA